MSCSKWSLVFDFFPLTYWIWDSHKAPSMHSVPLSGHTTGFSTHRRTAVRTAHRAAAGLCVQWAWCCECTSTSCRTQGEDTPVWQPACKAMASVHSPNALRYILQLPTHARSDFMFYILTEWLYQGQDFSLDAEWRQKRKMQLSVLNQHQKPYLNNNKF